MHARAPKKLHFYFFVFGATGAAVASTHGSRNVRAAFGSGWFNLVGLLLVRKKSDSYRTTYFAQVVAIGCENSTRELG